MADADIRRHVDEIEARVRPTICQTFSSRGVATVEGRITEDDFDVLLTAARAPASPSGLLAALKEAERELSNEQALHPDNRTSPRVLAMVCAAIVAAEPANG